jgi:hypothetical protein
LVKPRVPRHALDERVAKSLSWVRTLVVFKVLTRFECTASAIVGWSDCSEVRNGSPPRLLAAKLQGELLKVNPEERREYFIKPALRDRPVCFPPRN